MDTSETYIKMSEQAMRYLPECQAPYDDGEWVTYRHDRFLPEAIKNTVRVGDYLEPERCYWETWVLCGTDGVIHLLQQDQLQAMVKGTAPAVLYAFVGEAFDRNSDWVEVVAPYKGLTSMEQMWLAFVMKVKYSKTWNGEEWARV
jgi:hypothetical protein